MKNFPDIPPVWWLGSIVLIHVTAWLFPHIHFPTKTLQLGSFVLTSAALMLFFWAVLWFRKKSTPIEPGHIPSALIVEGPYRISRNPIYLVLVLMTLATAVYQGSLFGVIVTAGLVAILERRFVLGEEVTLLEAFGLDAEDFFQNTRRWI